MRACVQAYNVAKKYLLPLLGLAKKIIFGLPFKNCEKKNRFYFARIIGDVQTLFDYAHRLRKVFPLNIMLNYLLVPTHILVF